MLQLVARRAAEPRPEVQEARVSCIRSFDELAPRAAEWTSLLQRAETFTAFPTLEWHSAWWRAFADDCPRLAGIAREGRGIARHRDRGLRAIRQKCSS